MASVSDQFLVQMDLPSHPDEWFDFDNFMDWPSGQIDDHSTSMDSISPPDLSMPYEADAFLDSPSEFMQPTLSDMTSYDFPEFMPDQSSQMGVMLDASPMLDNTEFSPVSPYDNNTDAFRYMVEAHAAADTRVASIKEKRREASIALHLQRLCDATAIDLDMSSDSTTSFSSPSWSDFVRGSASPPSTNSSPDDNAPTPAPTGGNGGVEFVLDLNMNAATNLPKKQKPRSLAQKENYIKARKYGACEKHKKQHKRCNCLEKAAARVSVNESPTDVAFKQTPKTLSLQSSVSPTTRYSPSPGYDPRRSSPADALPINVVRKSANSSPEVPSSIRRPTSGVAGHDPSNSTSPVLPSVRATGRHNTSIPGHEPTFRPPTTPQTANAENRSKSTVPGHERSCGSPTALQSVKSTQANLGGQPGHDPSRNSPVVSKAMLTTTTSSDTQQRRIPHVSRSSGMVPSPEGGFLKHASSTANQPSPGAVGSLKWQASRLNTRSLMKPTNDQIQAIPCGFAGTVGLREPQGFGWCRRTVRGNNPNRSVLPGATQPLVMCTQLACSAKNQVCPRSSSTLEQLGGLLSGAIATLARAWQASSSLSFWVEDAMARCLSLSGRQLMSARKSLHLSHRRVI
ncbi:hypothetical protein N7474_005603 [Penicillium riverlandense]|uniref:uncharacterized protein n=1 Tax=Penicillium riverlandense TaxID=1903569 RepID=UPI0025478800|nr:uncharacterized protein N7474_005603 [Penicillium riverlandense]KAJ5820012.1 hypothetical protein N7474_005603 [Penicillium riverlandense]